MNPLVILGTGTLAILFVSWYFFGKRENVREAIGSSIDVKVDAGYSPSTMVLKKNQPITLKITRTNPSDCLEEIVIPEYKVKKFLPLHKTVHIHLEPTQSGEFSFSCGMHMFHGKIIVK